MLTADTSPSARPPQSVRRSINCSRDTLWSAAAAPSLYEKGGSTARASVAESAAGRARTIVSWTCNFGEMGRPRFFPAQRSAESVFAIPDRDVVPGAEIRSRSMADIVIPAGCGSQCTQDPGLNGIDSHCWRRKGPETPPCRAYPPVAHTADAVRGAGTVAGCWAVGACTGGEKPWSTH
eukprot:gene13993-biopygen21608